MSRALLQQQLTASPYRQRGSQPADDAFGQQSQREQAADLATDHHGDLYAHNILHNAQGPNNTITQSDAAGLLAHRLRLVVNRIGDVDGTAAIAVVLRERCLRPLLRQPQRRSILV